MAQDSFVNTCDFYGERWFDRKPSTDYADSVNHLCNLWMNSVLNSAGLQVQFNPISRHVQERCRTPRSGKLVRSGGVLPQRSHSQCDTWDRSSWDRPGNE